VTAQSGSNVLRAPGTDPKEVRPVGGVGGIEELALEGGQGLGFITDQQAVGEVEEMDALRLGQREVQRLEEAFQGRRRLYNAGQHGALGGGWERSEAPILCRRDQCFNDLFRFTLDLPRRFARVEILTMREASPLASGIPAAPRESAVRARAEARPA